MNRKELLRIRRHLGKTQKEMAQLLGTSAKAIQSFEQGWRNIPVHVERQVLFLLAMKSLQNKANTPCWVIQECPLEIRRKCPAWEFESGQLCWFINGTLCQAEVKESWQEKMKICRKCTVLRSLLSTLQE